MKLLLATGAIAATLLVGGCVATTVGALDHYDACSLTEPNLARMINCGKERRQAYCTKVNDCSSGGNLIVQYGDSLVASVKRGELSEPEARRRWVEFVISQRNQQAGLQMQAAAIMAASAPRTCNRIGTSVTCF